MDRGVHRHLSGADRRLDGRLGQPGRWRRAARQARAQLRRNLEIRAGHPAAFQLPSREVEDRSHLKTISASDIARLATHRDFVEALRTGFAADIVAPPPP